MIDSPPKVGDTVQYDGRPHTVVFVQRIFTRYTKTDQFTTVIGHTLGLKEIPIELLAKGE